MTFQAWIKRFEDDDTPFGDLAGDIAFDGNFTQDNTYDGTYFYLRRLGACTGAIETFKNAWHKYNKKRCESMNNFIIEVKHWGSPEEATNGTNDFINYCNDNDIEILDITSHVTEIVNYMSYVFIFKVRSQGVK